MREVRWERMFPDELEDQFAACPVVYFAYGLGESHGPQNALGLDTLKAHAIACHVARAAGGIVAPPDFWHIHELGGYAAWGHRRVGQVERKWLTAVPPWVHFKNVCYHLRAAVAHGLSATARVIAAVAGVMVCVFLSFVLGHDRTTKEFGLGLAVAIFVDATVVRLVLVPATMELLGDRNWWFPASMNRFVPRLNVEGGFTPQPSLGEAD